MSGEVMLPGYEVMLPRYNLTVKLAPSPGDTASFDACKIRSRCIFVQSQIEHTQIQPESRNMGFSLCYAYSYYFSLKP